MKNLQLQISHFNNLYSTKFETNFYYYIKRKMVKIIKKFIKKDSYMLDIGCGCGTVEKFLQCLQFKKCVGIDVSGVGIQKAKATIKDKRIEFLNLEFEALNEETKYDIITIFEVIEHIENYYNLLEKISKLLKEDGYLILSTPNRMRLENRIRNLFRKKLVLVDSTHIKEFTFKELKFVLEKYGFKILYYTTQGVWGSWCLLFFPNSIKKILYQKPFFRGETRINYYLGKIFKNFANYIHIVAQKNLFLKK